MSQVTVLLEISVDPLSDTTPTWVNATADVMNVEWEDGKDTDLGEPQAGSMTVRLKNTSRKYEPEFDAGLGLKPLNRARLSLNGTPEFFGYITAIDVQYPSRQAYSEVVVSCVDGFGLLSLDALDLLDPPSASSYEEVVMHDEPFAYYRLGEKTGTKLTATTGPDGIYKNTPTLGETGLITGDNDTAVTFTAASSEYARAPLEDTTIFSDRNQCALECILTPTTTATQVLLAGPLSTAAGFSTCFLTYASETFFFDLAMTDGTTRQVSTGVLGNLPAATRYHIFGDWDGHTASLYLDGDLISTLSNPGQLRAGNASEFIYIGQDSEGANFANAKIDEAVFYEHSVTHERVAAHYAAGTSGFAQQTAGERVASVATSALWAETEIQTGAHDVQPVMEHGQSKLDEIRAAVKAEMPMSQFFFNGDGDPVYLGWEYKAAAPYNEPAAIFGDDGAEIPYLSVEPVYNSDEILNEITVSHQTSSEGEASHTVTDATSEGEFFRRAHSESGLILVHHHDAEAVAAAILENTKDARWRFQSISLSGANNLARTQILGRELGDCIRIRKRGLTGDPIDVITWIIGRSKRVDVNGHLWCTWQTARGFNAAVDGWRLGIVDFSELGETTVLG